MANDPNTIQYVIQEDGFWYIASKDRTPGVPGITVSSKGIANGLSTEYNDGYDFGPDSYNPSVTSGVPLTQTSGIQEAVDYQYFNPSSKILIHAGIYNCSVGLTIYSKTVMEGEYAHAMYDTYISPSFALSYGVVININASGVNGISGAGDNALGPKIRNIIVNFTTSTTGHGIYLIKSDTSTQNPSFFMPEMDNVFVMNNDVNHYGFYFDTVTNVKFGKIGIIGGGGIHYGNSTDQNIGTGTIDYIYHFITSTGTSSLTNFNEFMPTNSTAEHLNSFNLLHINYIKILNTAGTTVTNALYANYLSISTFGLIDLETSSTVTNNINIANSYNNVFLNITGNTTAYTITSDSSSANNVAVVVNSGLGTPEWNTNNLTVSYGSNGYIYGSVNDNPIAIQPSGYIFAKGSIRAQGAFLVYGGINTANAPIPSLSANPPVSGTVYQNANTYDIEIDLPVYATTAGTAGYVTVAKGSTSTPTAIGNQFVSGSTSSTSTDIIKLRVPANWYYEFTASGVTFGTASVFAD